MKGALLTPLKAWAEDSKDQWTNQGTARQSPPILPPIVPASPCSSRRTPVVKQPQGTPLGSVVLGAPRGPSSWHAAGCVVSPGCLLTC